jgi:hypothetical protein
MEQQGEQAQQQESQGHGQGQGQGQGQGVGGELDNDKMLVWLSKELEPMYLFALATFHLINLLSDAKLTQMS